MNKRKAAKAFIVNSKNELLIIKREPNNVMMPNIWEIPGGRLEEGEEATKGLEREVLEECGIGIRVIKPFSIRHFTRTDGEEIELTIYYCQPKNEKQEIKLSAEHTNYEWILLEKAKEKIHEFYYKELELFEKIKNVQEKNFK
jgi:mutator protein MutT